MSVTSLYAQADLSLVSHPWHVCVDVDNGSAFLPNVNVSGHLQLAGAPNASQIRFGPNVDLQANTSNSGPTLATNKGPMLTTLFRRETFAAPGALAYLKAEGLNTDGGSYSPVWIAFSTRNNTAGQESGYFDFMYQTNGGLLQHPLYVGDLGEGFPYHVVITDYMLVQAPAQFNQVVTVKELKIGNTTLTEDDIKKLLSLAGQLTSN